MNSTNLISTIVLVIIITVILTLKKKKEKVPVNEETYNQAKIGDRYEKLAGDYIPKKIP